MKDLLYIQSAYFEGWAVYMKIRLHLIYPLLILNLFYCSSSENRNQSEDIYKLPPKEQYQLLIDSACKKDSVTVLKVILSPYSIERYKNHYKNSEEILESIRAINNTDEGLQGHCKSSILNEDKKKEDLTTVVVSFIFNGNKSTVKMLFKREDNSWYFIGPLE